MPARQSSHTNTTNDPAHYATLHDLPPVTPHAFAPGSLATARLGKIAVARAGWGHPVDNALLIRHFVAHGWDVDDASEQVFSTGFTSGYYYPLDNDIYDPDTQAWHTTYAANLAARVAAMRGWDTLDLLVISGCSMLNTIHHDVVRVLRERGVQVDTARLYAMACNAGMSAIDDILREAAPGQPYHGLRVVVVGMETFSGGRMDYDNPITVRTFANGGGAIAFIPGVEIEFIMGTTVVEFDQRGVVSGPYPCKLPPPAARRAAPAWYTFADDDSRDRLYTTAAGDLYMQLPYSDDGRLRSDGMATAGYFARRVPGVVMEMVTAYRAQFAATYGALAPIAYSHQPSGPVIAFLMQELTRHNLLSQGIEKRRARKLARLTDSTLHDTLRAEGVTLPTIPRIDWFMPRTGFNNTPAGTGMIVLHQMIVDGTLAVGRPVAVYAFGVGSVISASVWRFCVGQDGVAPQP
jgi:hypothetical protein